LDLSDPNIKDYLQMKRVLESGGHFEGFNRKLQLKVVEREQAEEGIQGVVKKITVVLKWGG
jgi:inositol hexakisphosphate/diphosphoinositol-pentakisphosphate kinase